MKDKYYDISSSSETFRFLKKNNNYIKIGTSHNCGLESYLCESIIRALSNNLAVEKHIRASFQKLISEAIEYEGKYFWRWEKFSSLPNVYFPLDWDDTCKAIDFISFALINSYIDFEKMYLPNNEIWEQEIRKSLFKSHYFGEDLKIPLSNSLSLSVFFGTMSEKWSKRDDPMVTITAIRSTCLWYPVVYNKIKEEVDELMQRLITISNYIFEYKVPFSFISRYYFSFGHFIYRMIETMVLLDTNPLSVFHTNIYDTIEESFYKVKSSNEIFVYSEDLWWILIGLQCNIISKNKIDVARIITHKNINDDYLYRHRRLNHYYYAEKWNERLIYWEYFRMMTTCNNIKNQREKCFANNYGDILV